MTPDIAVVLILLVAAMVVLSFEWLPADVITLSLERFMFIWKRSRMPLPTERL